MQPEFQKQNQPVKSPRSGIPPAGKKSNLLSIILGVAGLIIISAIITGGALLASHAWNPYWNPFRQKEDQGLKEKIFKK